MKSKKILMFLLVLVLTITCMPITAMASEPDSQVINILKDGFYITDPDGNVVPTPLFIIDEDVELPPGYAVNAQNNVWYSTNILVFSASVSNANVEDLELRAQRVNPAGSFNSLGSFDALYGEWYGTLVCDKGMPDGGTYCYYRIKFVNNGDTTMTIDSITGDEIVPM